MRKMAMRCVKLSFEGRKQHLPGQIAAQDVQQHSLSDIIRVVSRHDAVCFREHCTAIQCLPPQHAAICAVVLCADLAHNVVHRPAVQMLIGEHREWDAILRSRKRCWSVTGDATAAARPSGAHIQPRISPPSTHGRAVCTSISF